MANYSLQQHPLLSFVANGAMNGLQKGVIIANSRNIAKWSNPVKSCSADLCSKFQKFRPPLEAARGNLLFQISGFFANFAYPISKNNMTKAEIVTEIAKTTGIEKANVLAVVEGLMTSIKDSLAHGENVYLRGFGSFIVKERKEKTARNISKNSTIIIPAHNIPAFKPAAEFKKEVAK